MSEADGNELTKSQRKYRRMMRTRLGVADFAAWLRAGGIQMVWLTVLIAGAAIPLSESLIPENGGWEWVSPVLGFVIVVAAGIERVFSRTTSAAVALDELRRSLARERRLLLAGSDEYAEADDRFAMYAKRAEDLIAQYDKKIIDYNDQVLRSS